MPQASDLQRALMAKWFPKCTNGFDNDSGIDDGVAIAFLLARGWTETSGLWHKPTLSYQPSVYEVECLTFLRDEWDHDWAEPLFYTLEHNGDFVNAE